MAPEQRRPLRIWFDGCFDMMHFGHANALRQAKELGDYLVVGVHSDVEVERNKGLPVMREEERYRAVEACKWVDQVVRDAPYTTTLDMMDAYNCDICVHGDDLVTAADGTDTYAAVKAAGRFKEVKRTESVSTTELVGRMLLMTRDHHIIGDGGASGEVDEKHTRSPYTASSKLLPSTKRIVQFASPIRELTPEDRVVYVDGAFDLFHVGHTELLKRAREMGTYVLVGVHDDITINRVRGSNYPVMNLHERVLGVLSCRYVDEVIIGAPYSVTHQFLTSSPYRIHAVLHGKTPSLPDVNGADPYAAAKALGLYKEVETEFSHLTAHTIINRIIERRQVYEERNRKKEAKEIAEMQRTRNASNGA